ncbi:MAG TPA: hypothetical protein VFJ91_06470, partial [Gaiellaceae bacterium]|nr:hypothetical protein [Gaiellaceae bacterium]
GDVWYVVWTSGGTQYFLEAEYPGSTVDPSNPGVPVDYSYGDIEVSPTGGALYHTLGTATGSSDTAAGTIPTSAPADAFGLAANATLGSATGQTFESVGTPATGGLLEAADTAGPGGDYTLGSGCSTSSSGSGGGHGHGSGGGSHGGSGSGGSGGGSGSGGGAHDGTSPGSGSSHGSTSSSGSRSFDSGTTTSSGDTSTQAGAASDNGVAAAHATRQRAVRAHGSVRVHGGKGTAIFSIRGSRVVYVDRAQHLRFHSVRILSVRWGAHFALLRGLGMLNGRKVHFTARAVDRGAKGDLFRIVWTHGRARGGKLVRGSVVVA